MKVKIHSSSFRDPSGFLFYENGKLLRQVNHSYKENYDHLLSSGLHEKLVATGLLIPDKETGHRGLNEECYKVIEPEELNFISYPYEWSFNQLKDAALATLEIQKIAIQYGMILKDASAYNIQFLKGQPVLLDTLSFEIYKEGDPWQAYRQFCQHFLAPLALMSYTDLRLSQLMRIYIDGIPLDLASRLLPFRTRLNISLLIHIHLHAKAQKKYEHRGTAAQNIKIPLSNLKALTEGLNQTLKNLRIKTKDTEWSDYYSFTNYSKLSFENKKQIISRFLKAINPKIVWDLGANTGEFTLIGSRQGATCIAFDMDMLAVDSLYTRIKQQHIDNLLPLVLDLTNPSPGIGWNNKERKSLTSRPLPHVVLALALVHHLAISNNLPFRRIAKFLHKLSGDLIIEFVPKSDSQVIKLLESRKDIFDGYNEENFVRTFEEYFKIISREKISDSERSLFWMKRK